ncbi:MAG: hypothetical protein JSU94_12025 [Phycisphaerales bacterium]|nr:MAG: hypothetical protein JSU94_12025 [Phycisphaerales bacterium]
MQADKKNVLLTCSVAILLLAGCSAVRESVQVIPSDSAGRNVARTESSNRFQESTTGPTAVESAIELSEKYAKLADHMAALREQNQGLAAENQRLKDELVPCRAQLAQAQKELAESNELLIDMRIELNNWKADILGFRDEMREANKAQIEALLKVLEALGGEVPAEPPQINDTGSTNEAQNEPNQT